MENPKSLIMKMTKQALAAAAHERGETRFNALCQHHGETAHYSSDAKCVACRVGVNAKLTAKRQQNPDARNAYERELYATSDKRRGQSREKAAARDWRKKTEGTLAGLYELERETIQRLYGDCREGFEIDHACPKVAYGLIDGKRERIVSGTHSYANLIETPKAVNRLKRTQFAADTNRLQRPANRHPGGAFDPQPTAPELELITNAEYEGTPASVSLAALSESLDAQARTYEAHVEAVEADLCVRYSNAIAMMLGYVGMGAAGNDAAVEAGTALESLAD